jgi:hypothetical protein
MWGLLTYAFLLVLVSIMPTQTHRHNHTMATTEVCCLEIIMRLSTATHTSPVLFYPVREGAFLF